MFRSGRKTIATALLLMLGALVTAGGWFWMSRDQERDQLIARLAMKRSTELASAARIKASTLSLLTYDAISRDSRAAYRALSTREDNSQRLQRLGFLIQKALRDSADARAALKDQRAGLLNAMDGAPKKDAERQIAAILSAQDEADYYLTRTEDLIRQPAQVLFRGRDGGAALAHGLGDSIRRLNHELDRLGYDVGYNFGEHRENAEALSARIDAARQANLWDVLRSHYK